MLGLNSKLFKLFLEEDWWKPDLFVNRDFKENDDNYLLKVALPGAKKGDVGVEVDSGLLNIKSTTFNGEVDVTYLLPSDVNTKGIITKLVDGVLEVDLPKSSENKISVEVR